MQYPLTSTLVATTLLLSSSTIHVLAAPLQLDLSQLQHVDVTNPLGVGPQVFPTHEEKEKRRVISTGVFHGQLPKTGEYESLPIVNKRSKREAEPVFPGQYDDPRKQRWEGYFGNQQVDGSKKTKREAEAEALQLLPGMEPINPEGCDDPLICASHKKREAEAEAEAEALELLPGMRPVNPKGCNDPFLCASLKKERREWSRLT